MSASIQTLIYCDVESPVCPGECYCEAACAHKTAAQQRREFPDNGWHRVSGKDCCPKCWDYLKENGRTRKSGKS